MTDETKEQTRRRYYDAFRAWFESENSSCDFWSECDAPEALASIAVDMQDEYAAVQRQAGIREGIEMSAQHQEALAGNPTLRKREAELIRALSPVAPKGEGG